MIKDGEFYQTVKEIDLWVKIAGSRHQTTPLVIIHGGPGGNNYVFEHTIGKSLESFRTIIYYEQRGCGRSKSPHDHLNYSIPILLQELRELLNKLNIPTIIPLGYSFGGELALEFALKYPEHVEKIIAQAPSMFSYPSRIYWTQIQSFYLLAKGEMRVEIEKILTTETDLQKQYSLIWDKVSPDLVDQLLFVNQNHAQRNREMWEESQLTNTGEMLQALQSQSSWPNLMTRLSEITLPVLLLVGLFDRNVGLDLIRDIHSIIPNSHLEIFHQSAHFPDIEEEEKYIFVIKSFLQSKFQDSE